MSARRGAAEIFRAILRRLHSVGANDELRVRTWRAEADSWIAKQLGGAPPQLAEGDWSARVEERAEETQRLGEQPLWSGYSKADRAAPARTTPALRCSNQVRTSRRMGRFFSWIITNRRPSIVVEFGTAFGVSGMYWLSGLEMNRAGWLHTFEPNQSWATIAEANLTAVGTRFTLTRGTFEDNVALVIPREQHIDLAFIDAIHTSAFVDPQFELVAARLAPGGLVLLDDIDFSSDMQACWSRIREDPRLVATAEVGRVGIVEFGRS